MDIRALTDVGLTKNEADIFLALARKDFLSVLELAKLTGLNRPYIYHALDRLIEKGFVSKFIVNEKSKYRSNDFGQILSLEEEKVESLKSLAEEISQIKEPEKDDIYIEILKGKNVVKSIFRKALSELKPNEEVLTFGIDEEKMEEIEPIYLSKIFNFCKKNNITEKAIIKRKSKSLHYAKNTKYKYINPKIIGDTAQIIYQDNVINIIYGLPAIAVLIKSKKNAESERKKFKVFWNVATRN